MKEQASNLFKAKNYRGAIEKFKECLKIDSFNIHYNSTIYLNMAIAMDKLSQKEEALDALNKSV